jgi:predicted phage baseplate assembly protein
MKQACNCCEGPSALTPAATANPPGLSKLAYRVGTHATFLQTMQARLSSVDYPVLPALRTRERSDPSIALLDAWSVLGDVLTFYQERIVNEGYLRTATERRSVLELARLVGYALQPGVAASVYLAYALDKDAAPVEILKGALASSVPAPGEQMQAFETAEPLLARFECNALKPRMTRPQFAADVRNRGIYFKGTATKLRPNDPLCIVHAPSKYELVWIKTIEPDSDNDRTLVILQGWSPKPDSKIIALAMAIIERFRKIENFEVSPTAAMTKSVLELLDKVEAAAQSGAAELAAHLERDALPELRQKEIEAKNFAKLGPWITSLDAELHNLGNMLDDTAGTGILSPPIMDALLKRESITPRSAKQLSRTVERSFSPGSDSMPRLLSALQPALSGTLYPFLRNVPPSAMPPLEVHALRVVAAPFGHNAPPRITFQQRLRTPIMDEWEIDNPLNEAKSETPPKRDHHEAGKLYLDGDYDIAPDSIFVTVTAGNKPIITRTDSRHKVDFVHRALTAYGLSGKTVQVNLPERSEWIPDTKSFVPVRSTRIYTGSEKLDLAEVPILDDIAGAEIELADIYEGLEAGRWLIIAGERTDIIAKGKIVRGVRGAELMMIAAVHQQEGKSQPGERPHTFVTLSDQLNYTYRRDTVTIYGNVVKATHGETRREVLGSGDAAKAFQTFTLKQSPLTFVSAPTVSGIASTLELRVNDVQWHEAAMLAALGPKDRKFLTRTDDDSKTSIVFGDGEYGLRLPTGVENVKATYRNGIGQAGNVKAGQITLLQTRPLGVKDVTNPIRASGGADKEGRDQARKNTPLALMALDRLVSTSDYADFARTFAGIGKAVAARTSDGHQQLVRVVIAGSDDIPIEPTPDLYRNLYAALHRYGDPYLPITLDIRVRTALVIGANVKIDPDYQWETLEPKIRAALLDRCSFERTDIGQHALLSDAVNAIQAVRGVVYVDVDVFAALSEPELLKRLGEQDPQPLGRQDRIAVKLEEIAYLLPDVPDTLILQELKS